MIHVKIEPTEDFKLPRKATKGAACFDVHIGRIEEKTDGMIICYLGFKTEIPFGYKGNLLARSSMSKYGWVLANGTGIIDDDFRGEWQARFRHIPVYSNNFFSKLFGLVKKRPKFPYKVGERVAQVYFDKVIHTQFNLVNSLSKTKRKGGY